MNLYNYINKYGDLSFKEKGITDIDVLIFSQLTYLNFNDVPTSFGIKLSLLWEKTKEKNKHNKSFSSKSSFKIMNKIYKTNRYKDIIIYDYVYYLKDGSQFGALTLDIYNYICVCFEGTDDSIWGWRENFELTYIYPTLSQSVATKYLKDKIKKFKKDTIVCGHSKGGNLALVSAMRLNLLYKSKVKKIYSFDGPGLKEKEFKSINYKLIRKKLINIIPNLSFVGVLLEQENVNIIKSSGIGIYQHDVFTWNIIDDKLKSAKQDALSIKFDLSINRWLKRHSKKERKEIIEAIFDTFDSLEIHRFSDIKLNKINKVIKSLRGISKETKDVINNSIKLLKIDLKTEFINGGKNE